MGRVRAVATGFVFIFVRPMCPARAFALEFCPWSASALARGPGPKTDAGQMGRFIKAKLHLYPVFCFL